MADSTFPTAGVTSLDGLTGRRNRALLRNFFRRELTDRYLGSVSGLAWALLHPLALLAVYHFVFATVFRAGRFEGQSFLLFVAVALWPWLAAQEALQRATVSLVAYAGLIRKVAFPHELVIYASVAATLALQFAGYAAVLVALFLVGEPVHFAGLLVAIPLWIVMAVAVTGLALCLAALQVFVRDVEHVLMPTLMILMYLTLSTLSQMDSSTVSSFVGSSSRASILRRAAAIRSAPRMFSSGHSVRSESANSLAV